MNAQLIIINIWKFKCIQFSKSLNYMQNRHQFNDSYLENVTVIRDLGVIFDRNFTFSQQTEDMKIKNNIWN